MIKKRLFKKERRSNNIPRNQDKNRTVNFFPLFFFLHIIPLYIIYFSSSPSSPSFVYRLVIVMIPLVFPFLLPRLLLCNNINEYTYMYASLYSTLLRLLCPFVLRSASSFQKKIRLSVRLFVFCPGPAAPSLHFTSL